MTPFEILSIITSWVQLGLIGFGLWLMQQSGQRRDKQLDIMAESMREQITGMREQREALTEQREALTEQGAGIRALLERTA